jgi:anti-sigma28 factor (negative regulator of flagellin synthesis)
VDDIKINLVAPVQLNTTLKTNGSKANTTGNNAATVNHSHSEPSNQMARLMNIIKAASGDARSADAIQKIKGQVESGEYSVDILSLVEHLFQELSVDGDVE